MADTTIDSLVVRITADASLLQQEFNKARQSTQSFAQGSGSDLASFGSKTREAGDEIVRLKSELLALVGVGAFKDLIEGAFDYADSLTHLSQQTGLSTDMLQTLQAAGERVNLSTESMDQALKSFVERLGVFASTGGGQAAKAFQLLGVSTSNPIAAFDQVITKLAGISDTATRAGLAGQVFGREFGPAMAEIATGGVEGLVELQAHLQSTGAFLTSELLDKAAQTKSQFDELEFVFKQAFDEGIIEGFVSNFGSFADIVKSGEFQTAIRNFGTVMGDIAAYVVKIGPYLPNIAGVWAGMKVGAKVGAMVPGAGETGTSEAVGTVVGGVIGGVAPEVFKGGPSPQEQITDLKNQIAKIESDIVDVESVPGATTASVVAIMQKTLDADKAKLAALQAQVKATATQSATVPFGTPTGPGTPIKPITTATTPTVNPDDRAIQNLQQQVQIQEEINDGKQRQAAIDQALARLSDTATAGQRAQVTALAGQLFDEAQVAAQKKAIDDVNKSIDVQITKMQAATKELSESDEQKYVDAQVLQAQDVLIRKGVTDLDAQAAALDKVRQAATQAYEAQQQQQRINQVTDMEKQAYESLGNSIAQAAAQGQLSFKSLLSIGLSVAQQLEEAFLKLAILNPIENAIFGGSPGYSNLPTLGDFSGSALGKATSGVGDWLSSAASDIGDFFGGFFADGGPVDPTKAYVVGETGPEIFVPNVAGRIVPNSGASAGASNSGASSNAQQGQSRPTFVMNVQTRDAQSFMKSESQVASMMSRVLARGQRNL